MADKKVEKISLKEIVELCEKFNRGEISQKEMEAYGNDMIIRGYIPILEKLQICASITLNHLYSGGDAQEVKVAELYKYLFFYGLLSGYGMIDCSDKNLITFNKYDLIYPIFAPFILNYCELDYNNLKDFVKDSINFYNIKDLVENFENINPDILEKASESNKELIKSLEKSKDLIANIKELKQMDNPLLGELAHVFVDETIKAANKI